METNKYYVYALLDPRKSGEFKYGRYSFDFEPFYIGKGSGRRIKKHFASSNLNNDNHNRYKNNKIKKILSLRLYPLEFFWETNLSEEEAFRLEENMIEAIGRKEKGGPLTNIKGGGEGASLSEETKIKLSIANKGNTPWIKGRTHSDKSKNLISKNNAKYWLGKTYDEKRKKEMSEITKKQDFSFREKIYECISPFGEIHIVKGLKEFCRNNNLTRSKMVSIATNKSGTHKGWRCKHYETP